MQIRGNRDYVDENEWMGVIFVSMWRLLLICTAAEIALLAGWTGTDGTSFGEEVRRDLFVPCAIQSAVVIFTKLFFLKCRDTLSDLQLVGVSVFLTNFFAAVMVVTHPDVTFLSAFLFVPIVLVSVYKRKELIRIQFWITILLYLWNRLFLIPDRAFAVDVSAAGDITAFLVLALAFAVLGEQIRKSSIQLDIQVWKDSLTNLYNHEAFYEELKNQMELFEEKRESFSIFVIDIDNFKQVNDTYGHAYGDEVIRTVAHVIEKNRGSKDFAARYGGEEFAMICPGKRAKEVVIVADKIRREIAERSIESKQEPKCFTVSIGVAEYCHTYQTGSSFFEEADQALYEAKATGKNKVCCNR